MTIPLKAVPEACAYLGCAATGKTQALVERAVRLVSDGVSPRSILVLCAAPQACSVMEQRLHAAGAGEGISVLTPQALALKVLDTPQARAFTGRRARVLLPFERDLLLEDLMTSGIKRKRLKEMLRFFERNWTELAEDDDAWLMEGEETYVHTYALSCLATLEALLDTEVSPLAVRYLLSDAEALEQTTFEHVLVDDYQMLSRASHVLASLVARSSVSIAADPYAQGARGESFPYLKGVGEFLAVNTGAQLVQLDTCRAGANTAGMVNALLADPAMACDGDELGAGDVGSIPAAQLAADQDVPTGALEEYEGTYVQDVLDHLLARINRGLADGLAFSEICVTYTNEAWGRRVKTSLAKQGMLVSGLLGPSTLAGDIHEFPKCTEARLFALLELLAEPDSALAWRAMCGFGDSIAESYGFQAASTFARQRGLSLPAALELLQSEPELMEHNSLAPARLLMAKYERVRTIASSIEGFTGQHLIDALALVTLGPDGASIPQGFEELVEPVREGDTAQVLYQRALERASLGAVAGAEGSMAIRVLHADDLTGQVPKLLLFPGFVNGFTPQLAFLDKMQSLEEEVEAAWDEDVHRMYRVAGTASSVLWTGSFTRISVEDAERYKLGIERIRADRGSRVALVSRSQFADMIRIQQPE